jgi:hypothetical protein
MNRDNPCKRDPDLLRQGRRLFCSGLALFALGTVLVALWVLGHDTLDEIQVLQAQLEEVQPWMLLWRLLVLGGLLGGYDVWVNALADRFKFPSWQRQQALKQRRQVVLLLLLAELLIGQQGLTRLVHCC